MHRANSIVPPDDTIYALSSGALPAAIAVVRISGRAAGSVLRAMAGDPPRPRQASLRKLVDAQGELLDRALILWMPGPDTATGEDVVELHLHGGRAVVGAVMRTLDEAGLRLAEPGEFTRRALFNGRMDVSAVEGLADLLAAETETQRTEALLRVEGVLGRKLRDWSARLVSIAARVEADIDYDGEDNTSTASTIAAEVDRLRKEIEGALSAPTVERLRDGIRVAIVGPPNAGKSTLFNALVGDDAAIVSPLAGTTRDAIERPVSLGGLPFLFVDTAGLRETNEPVEQIGVERAHKERERADIVVDLAGRDRPGVIGVSAKADIADFRPETIAISAVTGAGLDLLQARLLDTAGILLPQAGEVALSRRYREGLGEVVARLSEIGKHDDIVIVAEDLRVAMTAVDRLTGTAGFEDMLDALFGRFCLGK